MAHTPPKVEIVRLTPELAGGTARLWRRCFPQEGFRDWGFWGKAMTAELLRRKTLERKAFEPAGSFTALADGRVVGFALAVMRTKGGAQDGQLCALAVDPRLRRRGLGSLLLQRAEQYLRRRGAKCICTTFERNPLTLLPGVPTDAEALPFFLNRGFRSYDSHILLVMRQDMERFRFPRKLRERIRKLAAKGIKVGRMKPEERKATERFLAADFAGWHNGISASLDRGQPMIIAASGKQVLGFSGPFYTHGNRGDFFAVGVSPKARGTGLGSVLFNVMSEELRAKGARVVMLTVVLDNPAQEIYVRAGYHTQCAVDFGMKKKLAAGDGRP